MLLVLFCLLFTPWGAWSVVEGIGAAREARKVKVIGLVIQSRVRKSEELSRKTPWLREWLIEYTAGGEVYRRWFVIQAHSYEKEAADGGGVDKSQPVWFEPAKPDRATTVPPDPVGRALTAAVCGFAGAGGLGSMWILLCRLTKRCT